MENKKLVLKGRQLFGPDVNIRKLCPKAGISIPSAYRILDHPERIERIDLGLLFRLLSGGLGMSNQQILDMRVGDLFEIGGEDGQKNS